MHIFFTDFEIKREPILERAKPITNQFLDEIEEELKLHPPIIDNKPHIIEPTPAIIVDEPLHYNENKPKVLESIPVVENNKNHIQLEPAHHPLPIIKKEQKEWNHEERRKVETRNNNMRQIIYKEVKRPGRNYDRLLGKLRIYYFFLEAKYINRLTTGNSGKER